MAKTTRKTNAKTTGSASGDEVKSKPTPAQAPAKKASAKKAGVKKAAAKKATVKKAPAKKASGEKPVAKKVAAKKAPAGQAAPAARKAAGGSNPSPPRISREQRHQMVEQAAYLRAESLGFCSDPREDWLTAEAEVDARLAAAGITVSD